MRRTMLIRRCAALSAVMAVLEVACSSPSSTGAAASASASASAAPAPSASAKDPTDRDQADEVRPNYPRTNDPPDPLAQKLCAAIYDLPAKRKTECCKGHEEPSLGAECTRVVSAALRSKASMLAEADVAACVAAAEKSYDGCDWVSVFAPRPPDACLDVIKGTLAAGAKCRSSVECADGMTCTGVGPTTIGTCSKPSKVGAFCGTGVDPLASIARADLETRHPPCDGVCYRNKCAPAVALGGACKSPIECGRGHACVEDKCSDKALPAAGEACAGALCAQGAICRDKKCRKLGAAGDECVSGLECRSGKCGGAEKGHGKCESACITPPKKK